MNKIHFPSVNEIRRQWTEGYRFLLISTPPNSDTRNLLFGKSVEDLQEFAATHDHKDVVILFVEFWGAPDVDRVEDSNE